MQFLFIEIKDEEILQLYGGLREILSDRKIQTSLHITIKESQESPFKEELINIYPQGDHPLVLSGIGCFEYSGVFYVHAKVQIQEMGKYQLWHKPTFSGEKKNPHVTICETSDIEYARNVQNFLKHEVADLICVDYDFVSYSQTKQIEMFDQKKYVFSKNNGAISRLINIEKINKDIFCRANSLATRRSSRSLSRSH